MPIQCLSERKLSVSPLSSSPMTGKSTERGRVSVRVLLDERSFHHYREVTPGKPFSCRSHPHSQHSNYNALRFPSSQLGICKSLSPIFSKIFPIFHLKNAITRFKICLLSYNLTPSSTPTPIPRNRQKRPAKIEWKFKFHLNTKERQKETFSIIKKLFFQFFFYFSHFPILFFIFLYILPLLFPFVSVRNKPQSTKTNTENWMRCELRWRKNENKSFSLNLWMKING